MPSWFWHKRCDFWTKYYKWCTNDCVLHARHFITHSCFVQSGLHGSWHHVLRQNLTGERYKKHDLHSWWRYSVIRHAILILYQLCSLFFFRSSTGTVEDRFLGGDPTCEGARSQHTQWLVSRSPIGWQFNYAECWSINAMPSRHASFFG